MDGACRRCCALRYQAIALMRVPVERHGHDAGPRSSGEAPGGQPRLEQRSRTGHGHVAGKVDPAKRASAASSSPRAAAASPRSIRCWARVVATRTDSECEPRRCASSSPRRARPRPLRPAPRPAEGARRECGRAPEPTSLPACAPRDLVGVAEREPGLVGEARGQLRVGHQRVEVGRSELRSHRAPARPGRAPSSRSPPGVARDGLAPAEHDLVPAHPELESLLPGDSEPVGGSFADGPASPIHWHSQESKLSVSVRVNGCCSSCERAIARSASRAPRGQTGEPQRPALIRVAGDPRVDHVVQLVDEARTRALERVEAITSSSAPAP